MELGYIDGLIDLNHQVEDLRKEVKKLVKFINREHEIIKNLTNIVDGLLLYYLEEEEHKGGQNVCDNQ